MLAKENVADELFVTAGGPDPSSVAGAAARRGFFFASAEGSRPAMAIEAKTARTMRPIPDPSETRRIALENRISIDASNAENERLLA
jgi:hypothetical protein